MASHNEIPNDPAAPPLDDHNLEQTKRREEERLLEDREADSKQKNDELAKREQDVASKEQAFDKKRQDFEKKLDDLKKREEAVRAAEDRVKKSKKGGQAEILTTQEENDKLKDKTKGLNIHIFPGLFGVKNKPKISPQADCNAMSCMTI